MTDLLGVLVFWRAENKPSNLIRVMPAEEYKLILMKRIILLCLLFAAVVAKGMAADADTLRSHDLEEVVVDGVRVKGDAPFAVSNISEKELHSFAKTSRELPFLFARTPGVLAWSENGLGTGTTYLRIRGAADSRINVTIDGVQMNSPEDECVFWANMNSYAFLLGGVQIQRGVGSSTNGDGAFGGNIALQTKAPLLDPSMEVNVSVGSYGTVNAGGSFSTGLLFDHLVFDGAYHHTRTDGFMHGTSGKSGSYYGGLTWYGKNVVLRYKNIGNYEKTGQAWNGLDTGDLLDGNYGVATGLNSYKDFWNAGLGRYNNLFESLNDAYDASAGTSRYMMSDGSYWPKTTDNFWQDHNLLSAAVNLSEHWKMSGTLHYTYGYGYYDEFRSGNKLSKFGLAEFVKSDGETLTKTDFVRRKGLTQHTYGVVWNINYSDRRWDVVGGLSLQNFEGNHFGYLTYIADNELAEAYLANGRYKYYDSDAEKTDGNVFAKATFKIDKQWSAFIDLQYRHVAYITTGINDKFYSTDEGYENQRLDINEKYGFFNPKAGVNWQLNGHRAYASIAVSHREPERNNFTDNGSYDAPKAERLTDLEIGYAYNGGTWHAGLGAYYMKYRNQFVQTGEVSDIGEALTTNIKDSYRMGIELTADYSPWPFLELSGNAALSANRIKDFDEHVEDWDNGEQVIHYDNSTLAFSPAAILNGFVTFSYKGLEAVWHTNFVSRQYLDNTASTDRALPAYSQSDLSASYTFKLKRAGTIIVGCNLNNVFNRHYAASGWVYSAIYESGGHTNDNRYREIGFIPMAGRNAMANLTFRF